MDLVEVDEVGVEPPQAVVDLREDHLAGFERIQGYEKDKMKSVQNTARSMMPLFGADRLSDSDLDDLVRYLQTLRGFDPAVLP